MNHLTYRKSHLLGFVLGHWDVKNILNNSLALLPVAGMDVQLSDVSQQTESILSQHLSRSRLGDEQAFDGALRAHKDFSLADRTWRLSFVAAPAFFDEIPLQRTWQTILACVAVMFLLVIGFFIIRFDRLTTQNLLAEQSLRADLKISQIENEKLGLEMKVQHTERLESLGIMAGGVAHDFNNILTAILGNAGLALMQLADAQPKVSEYLRVIEDSSMRAAGLCKQMLAYSGQGHFIVKPLSLTNEINSMKELLHSSVSNKIELVYMLDEQLARVMADKTQIDQIMLNLVLNSF